MFNGTQIRKKEGGMGEWRAPEKENQAAEVRRQGKNVDLNMEKVNPEALKEECERGLKAKLAVVEDRGGSAAQIENFKKVTIDIYSDKFIRAYPGFELPGTEEE